LASGAIASDTLVVVAYGAFNVSNTYTQAQADARYPLNSIDLSAGKNKVINGDFGIWQRGTSFTITSALAVYSADRHNGYYNPVGGTIVASQQTFTPGTAPVAGYEGQYYLRHVSTSLGGGAFYDIARQYVEDVRTFAGQTVTLSFWVRANTATSGNIYLSQNFGSGGSAGTDTLFGSPSITTSWTRISVTGTMPSIAGKTIGTNSYMNPFMRVGGNNTIEIWGVQLEAGSVATAFQTASGSVGGELALCQRYFWLFNGTGSDFGLVSCYSTVSSYAYILLPVQMRAAPSFTSTLSSAIIYTAGVARTVSSFTFSNSNLNGAEIQVNATPLVPGDVGHLGAGSSTMSFSAEL
jgi:hypothetical protein